MTLDSHSSTASCGRIALGTADCAVLDRLRAIALLLRAAAIATLANLKLGLRLDSRAHLLIIDSISWAAARLIARRAGWSDILGIEAPLPLQAVLDSWGRGGFPRGPDIQDPQRSSADTRVKNGWLPLVATVVDRTARAEFPSPCPVALRRLLARLDTHTASPADDADFLVRAGWEISPLGTSICPLLPEVASTHELLEARLVLGEGQTVGPLTGLAVEAGLGGRS